MQFKATSVRTVLGTLLVHGQHYGFSFLSAMATGSIGPCVWQKKKKDYTNCNSMFKSLLFCESLNLYQMSGPEWGWGGI